MTSYATIPAPLRSWLDAQNDWFAQRPDLTFRLTFLPRALLADLSAAGLVSGSLDSPGGAGNALFQYSTSDAAADAFACFVRRALPEDGHPLPNVLLLDGDHTSFAMMVLIGLTQDHRGEASGRAFWDWMLEANRQRKTLRQMLAPIFAKAEAEAKAKAKAA